MESTKLLEYALQREYEGKRFFVENAARLHHAAARQAFEKLAEEEQKHIDFILAHIRALEDPAAKIETSEQQTGATGLFQQRYNLEAVDQSVLESMVPDLPVLRMAYLIERDFAEFYELAAMESQGETMQLLLMLGQWERSHERYFKELHDRSFELYAQMPWGG